MVRSTSRRPYHHGDLRRTLLDAALALVEADGLAALSLREVAKRAGVTHGAPYHHFPDRGALMSAIAREGFILLRDALDAAATSAGADPMARLAAIGRAYVHFALAHRAHFRVMFRPELAHLVVPPPSEERTAYDVLAQAVRDCQEAGVAPHAAGLAPSAEHDVLAVLAWSTVHGLASLLLDGPLEQVRAPDSDVASSRAAPVLAEEIPGLLARLFAGVAHGGPGRPPGTVKKATRTPADRGMAGTFPPVAKP